MKPNFDDGEIANFSSTPNPRPLLARQMGADEQPSPTRKRDREEVDELADGGAAEKRPRAEGTSLLGLASYEDDEEEEAASGQANDHRAEGNGEEGEDEDDEEDDVRRAPERRPRQVELRRDCPYLDTVNRQVHLRTTLSDPTPEIYMY